MVCHFINFLYEDFFAILLRELINICRSLIFYLVNRTEDLFPESSSLSIICGSQKVSGSRCPKMALALCCLLNRHSFKASASLLAISLCLDVDGISCLLFSQQRNEQDMICAQTKNCMWCFTYLLKKMITLRRVWIDPGIG